MDAAVDARSARRGVWLCMTACAVILSAGACHSPYFLTVEDHVCRAGDDVKLIGKLEYRGVYIFNAGTDNKRVRFHLDGRSAMTKRMTRGTHAWVVNSMHRERTG
ncbi:MAG: hypothetical protein JXB13_15840 [Phycisphaerae bacterium]|nr:hypothetical protein [Phycisphaerae bacterium]